MSTLPLQLYNTESKPHPPVWKSIAGPNHFMKLHCNCNGLRSCYERHVQHRINAFFNNTSTKQRQRGSGHRSEFSLP